MQAMTKRLSVLKSHGFSQAGGSTTLERGEKNPHRIGLLARKYLPRDY